MIFLLAATLLCACVCAFLARPLFRGALRASVHADPVDVLKATLVRLEADRAAGLIGDPEAEEAVLEAKRAALGAPQPAASMRVVRRLRMASVTFLAATPLIVAAM